MVKLNPYRTCTAKSLILYVLYSGVFVSALLLLGNHTVKFLDSLTSKKKPLTYDDDSSHDRKDRNTTKALAGKSEYLGRGDGIANRDSVTFSRNGSDSLIHGSPELNGYIVNNIVDQAKIIANDFGSPVYFMMFNEAYKYLALNWLCNTASFEGTHERLMMVTTSKNACSMIRRKWGTALFCLTLPPEKHVFDWTNQKSFGYTSLRAYFLLNIIKNSVEVIALEPDSVWFKDPYPMFRRMSSRPEVDLASPMNAVTARIGEWRAYSPMLLKPSEASVALLRKLLEKLRKHGDSDLIVYNYLCMARYSGVVCENFLYEDVSDGKWFGLEGSEKSVLRPYILNNNYLNGKKKKEHRQKKFGLWFLSEQGQCNHQAVKRKLDSFSRAAEDEHAHV